MNTIKKAQFVIAAAAASIAMSAQAQDITSPDGEWRATLDANGTGQITNLFNGGGATDNLFETLWYENSLGSGSVSDRVELLYTNTGSTIGTNDASFSMLRNDGNMSLDIRVTMLDGALGGARFDLWWTNVSNADERLRAFAYADLDVAASAGGDFASLSAPGQLIQSDSGPDIYFTGLSGIGAEWEIQTFAGLRTDLDAGRTGLTNAGGGGPADFTSALGSGGFASLAPGGSYHATFQIGGNVPAPGAMALFGLSGVAVMRRRR